MLLREGATAPEILMVERAAGMAFAAGALVFPGGRVNAGDRVLAERMAGDPDDAAARIAAIRETIEEVGLAIGVAPSPEAATLAALRGRLHAGVPIAATLAGAGLALDTGALVAFARWRPAHATSRVYDTRFYLARLPAGSPPVSVDATETVRGFWSTARDTLATVDAGGASVIFPTRRNLERLARFATVEDAFADAGARPIETISPWIETRDGVEHLCIPEGIGYPVTAEPLANARRG